jgi:type II secretory pathway pseudopilin PulG
MLAVLVILGIVLAGLTQLFVSASKSQSDQTKRVGAQQDGRLALDKLRRELHCASAMTFTSASSITATLGTYCPTVHSTTLSSGVTLPAATISVASTRNFNTGGANTISFGSSGTVTCTSTTSTSFTGCSGGTAGTYASGTTVLNLDPVTWCATGSSAPFTLKRYVGAACSGSSGRTWANSLTSTSIFAQSVVPVPTLTRASTGGTLASGTYLYEVTAVTSTGAEIVGTVASTTFASGTTNKVTISWSAYPGASSYNVYGRDSSSGLRLLGSAMSSPYFDAGPTSLTSSQTVPASGPYTVAVGSSTGYGSSPYLISFGGSGTVTCTGATSTSFTGCSGGIAGTYASGTVVSSVSTLRPPLASMSVSLVLDKSPADTNQRFTLNDVIEFRNSRPF